MSDLEEQLNSILGDPEQMSRIADLAKSLMGGEDGDAQARRRAGAAGSHEAVALGKAAA